jgi:hypothetical protein
MLCVQWTVRLNPMQAGSEELLLKFVVTNTERIPSARCPTSKGGPNFLLKRREKEMGQVLPFRCNDVFPPEATAAMGDAYDTAIAALQDDAKSALIIREGIAKRIMRAAYAGRSTENDFASQDCRVSVGWQKAVKSQL